MFQIDVRILLWGLAVLIGIIGYLLSYYMNRTQKSQDDNAQNISETHQKLSDSINKLNLSITGLNGHILAMQDKNETFVYDCRERHSTIDKRLNDHSSTLKEHSKKIVELDIKLNK